MPKSPCPSGQTRNRVTKSCRDKKKPGRKPGTRKAAVPKTSVAVFRAYLINNDREEETLAYSGDHSARVINWYKQFKKDFKDNHNLDIKSITHVSSNQFKVKYIGNKDDLEHFLDVDEDGNYPISIHGVEYLISGVLV